MSTYISSLDVIPSSSYNIPQPGRLATPIAAAGSSTTQLVSTGAEFTAAKTRPLGYTINGGDIIYNATQSVVYQIVKVVNDTTIEIATASVAIAPSDTCFIYKGNVRPATSAASGSEGYSLYFGASGDVKVEDVSNNTVTLKSVPVGKIIDLQVIKIYDSNPTPPAGIVALEKID